MPTEFPAGFGEFILSPAIVPHYYARAGFRSSVCIDSHKSRTQGRESKSIEIHMPSQIRDSQNFCEVEQ